jgi:hypothetical protein
LRDQRSDGSVSMALWLSSALELAVMKSAHATT